MQTKLCQSGRCNFRNSNLVQLDWKRDIVAVGPSVYIHCAFVKKASFDMRCAGYIADNNMFTVQLAAWRMETWLTEEGFLSLHHKSSQFELTNRWKQVSLRESTKRWQMRYKQPIILCVKICRCWFVFVTETVLEVVHVTVSAHLAVSLAPACVQQRTKYMYEEISNSLN